MTSSAKSESDVITRVEMHLGWALDDDQKAFLRSRLSAYGLASPAALARLIMTPPEARW